MQLSACPESRKLRHDLVFHNQDPSLQRYAPSSSESCVAHYLQGRYPVENSFQRKNLTIHKVGYPGESVIQRSSMRDSSVVIMSTSKNSPYGKGLCRITFAIV